MAVIYNKTSSGPTTNCIILDPKQALILPFDFNGDWTKMSAMMVIGYTNNTDPNYNMDGYGTQSVVSATTAEDRIHYGFKTVSSSFPADNNEVFLGYRTYSASTYIYFPGSLSDQRNPHGPYGYIGVHHPNGSVEGLLKDDAVNQAFGLIPPLQNSGISNFAEILVFKFTILNKGQNNQQIVVEYGQQGTTDCTEQYLRDQLDRVTLSTLGTFQFNQSGTPFKLPDGFFIYNPILTVRTRVFATLAIKNT